MLSPLPREVELQHQNSSEDEAEVKEDIDDNVLLNVTTGNGDNNNLLSTPSNQYNNLNELSATRIE